MTNEFFAELARCLRKQGVESKMQKDRRLEIFLHGQPAHFVSPKNEVFLLPEMSENDEAGDLYHEVAQTSKDVFSYVEAVQNATRLKVSGLSEDFRLLADFGGTVLVGRERENGWGYQFVTWLWDYDRNGVSLGHYYEDDYHAAKQDFAVRSGLIDRQRLFSDQQLTEIYRCIHETLDSGYPMTDQRKKLLQELAEQIEWAVPELEERVSLSNQQELEAQRSSDMTQQF